jgi:hypothetical protein
VSGRIDEIFVGPVPEELPRRVESVDAVPGKGLRGDRYFRGEGTFWKDRKSGQDLTLIEAEALEALTEETGIELAAGATRRNLVTRGIGLNELVGRRFTVGEVECYGQRLCDPCAHLQALTREGVLRGLAGRGGLRADILKGGQIAVGDAVVEIP